MPVDTSIYGTIKGPQQLDINSLIETARAAQRLQGESSLGDIYSQATNPDGTIDAGKLGTLAPRAGVLAPQVAAQAQERALGQQAIDRNKLDNIREWWKTLDAELYSHMNDPDLNHRKVLDSIHSLIGHKNSELNGGIFTPQLATQASAWLWGPDGKPVSPDIIRKKLGEFHQRVLGNLASSEYVPIGVGPDGSQLYMTRNGAIARDAALPRGGAGAGAPGAVPPSGAPAAPAAPPPGVVAQPGGVPATSFTMPLGTAESTQAMTAGQQRESSYGQEIYPLEEALRVTDEMRAKYGDGFFGPGSKGRQDFKSYFYALSPTIARFAGINPDELKDYAKADKYLTQAVQTRAAGFGARTDQQLATTVSGSPNVHINDLAVDEVLKAMIALRRAERSQHLQSARSGPAGYLSASQNWPTNVDVRAFALDLLSPEQRQKLLGSIKKGSPEWTRFNNSVRAAYDTGVMSPPSAPIPGALKARDGNWYIRDPSKPNGYMQITLPGMGG